jgi:multiple sugar transport system ATP-binding protein
MRTEIKMLQEELGITVVFVTNDQEEALSMASTIVLINDGRIQQAGNPYEIYTKPVNMWVADFIGTPTMNFLEGTVRPDFNLEYGSGKIPLSKATKERIKANNLVDKRVIVGFRPEHMDLYRKEAPEEGAIKCSVKAVEFEGFRTIVNLGDTNGTLLKMSITSQRDVPEKDEVVWTKWSEGLEIMFDKNTQQRFV